MTRGKKHRHKWVSYCKYDEDGDVYESVECCCGRVRP